MQPMAMCLPINTWSRFARNSVLMEIQRTGAADARAADVIDAVAVLFDRQREAGVHAGHDGEIPRLAPRAGALHRLHLR